MMIRASPKWQIKKESTHTHSLPAVALSDISSCKCAHKVNKYPHQDDQRKCVQMCTKNQQMSKLRLIHQ